MNRASEPELFYCSDNTLLPDETDQLTVKPEPSWKIWWPELGCDGAESAEYVVLLGGEVVSRKSSKKRKLDTAPYTEGGGGGDGPAEMKMVRESGEEEETKITEERTSTCKSSNKRETWEKSKVSETETRDYIHVRARRGQATDSHSLAERVRRAKISEKMKYLQDLVPGCSRSTGKAGMLDEIINYVQSLQHQVEFLSMKLATMTRRFDSDIDDLMTKEIFPGFSTMASSSCIPLNRIFQPVEMVMNTNLDLGLRRTISTPVPVPDAYLETSSSAQMQAPLMWDTELQRVEFDQGRYPTLFHGQQFTGSADTTSPQIQM